MHYVTFSDMAARHGKHPAFKLLCLIERLAQIGDEITSIDLEARFQRAVQALSNIDFAA